MKIEPGTYCPLIKKDCMKLGCSWFVQVRGKHPQTGQEIDEWGCTMTWLPVLMIENSQQQRSTSAAVESFRNEMVKANETNVRVLSEVVEREQQANRIAHMLREDPKLIEAN